MPVKRASAVRTTEADVCEDPLFFAESLEVGTHGLSSCLGPGYHQGRKPLPLLQAGSLDERENSVSIWSND